MNVFSVMWQKRSKLKDILMPNSCSSLFLLDSFILFYYNKFKIHSINALRRSFIPVDFSFFLRCGFSSFIRVCFLSPYFLLCVRLWQLQQRSQSQKWSWLSPLWFWEAAVCDYDESVLQRCVGHRRRQPNEFSRDLRNFWMHPDCPDVLDIIPPHTMDVV